jgi:hypothetical protein
VLNSALAVPFNFEADIFDPGSMLRFISESDRKMEPPGSEKTADAVYHFVYFLFAVHNRIKN